MIEFHGIGHSFNGAVLFNGLNFKIAKGEKAVIRGSSGTGKSTLLNFVLGFLKPDSGFMSFKGECYSPKNITEIRNNIAWLPQDYNPIGAGKTSEVINILFSFKANKHLIPDNKKTEAYFEAVGLDLKLLDSEFKELSGGEKQRTGLVICKLLERQMLILDEPASSLDRESVGSVIDFLFEDGVTVISSAHNEKWINSCSKVLELGNGRS